MKQKKNYTCGPSTIRFIINEYKLEGNLTNWDIPSEFELEEYLDCTPQKGTTIKEMTDFWNDNGFQCQFKENQKLDDLLSHKEKGDKIILLVSLDVPHYVVYAHNDNQRISFWDSFTGEYQNELNRKFIKERALPYISWIVNPETYIKASTTITFNYLKELNLEDFKSNCGAFYISLNK